MGLIQTAHPSLVRIIACGCCVVTDHARPVFSAMIATCGDKSETLHLTDHEFESSLNLSSVFEAMAAIDENHQHDTTRAAVRFMTELTVLFAQKYEMKSVLAALKTHLFGLATQYPPSGGQCWLAAAHMSEWALCGRLIASIGTGYQGPLVVHMRKKLDCKGWTPGTMFELARVSTRFLWAACQAGVKHQIPGITANYINYQGMGEDLAKLMLM
jgi:hypothetical protein